MVRAVLLINLFAWTIGVLPSARCLPDTPSRGAMSQEPTPQHAPQNAKSQDETPRNTKPQQPPARPSGEWFIYVGTYTQPPIKGVPSKGIYYYRFMPATGEIKPIGLAAETENPSFLAVHPRQRFLYAVNETSTYRGESTGSISAFAIDRVSGHLKLINQVSSKGAGPCHVAIDNSGKWLFAANYDGGSVASFPIRQDGSLGEASAFIQHHGSSVNREQQSRPHAHAAASSPDNRFVLVADLGLDEVLSYHFEPAASGLDPSGPLAAKVAPGSGPRHLAFHPDGRFLYVINELLSTVTAFSYEARQGSLHELQTLSTLPGDFRGSNSAAEIAVHPSGRFLYASNRGHDSIAIFRIDPGDGKLNADGHISTRGHTPRNFAIDPIGHYLLAANQDSNTLVEFHIDPGSGALTATGDVLEVPSPVCICFARAR